MLDLLQVLLRYVGFAIGAAASIWGMLHELTTKDAKGRKQLTREGKLALRLAVAGLATSFLTMLTGDIRGRLDSERRAAAEAARTRRIILAGQPLQSLEITWTTPSVDRRWLESYDEGTREVDAALESDDEVAYLPRSDYYAFRSRLARRYTLYPWLRVLAGQAWDLKGTVAALALGDAGNAVLPFGAIRLDSDVSDPAGWRFSFGYPDADKLRAIAAAVEFVEDLGRFPTDDYSPPVPRQRSISIAAYLDAEGDTLTATWHFDAAALSQVLDVPPGAPRPTALLPDSLQIIAATDLASFPFSPNNASDILRSMTSSDVASSYGEAVPGLPDSSEVTLVPNGLPTEATRYTMTVDDAGDLVWGAGGVDEPSYICRVRVWQGHRVPPADSP